MSVEIGSREQLMIDLTLALAPGSRERLLTVVRLHGLHAMAERSGTAARDQLLERAHRLTLDEVRSCGRLYLPRRDELCVLFDTPLDEAIRVLDDVTAALNGLDPTGDVTAEAGVALLPDEAVPPDRRTRPGRPPHPPGRLRRTRGMARCAPEPARGASARAAARGPPSRPGAAAAPPRRLEPAAGSKPAERPVRPRGGAPRCVRVVTRARPERPCLHRVRHREHGHPFRARLARVPLRRPRQIRAPGPRVLLPRVRGRRVRPGTVEPDGVTAALSGLTGSIWAFVRSDPARSAASTPRQLVDLAGDPRAAPRPPWAPTPLTGAGGDRRSVRRL